MASVATEYLQAEADLKKAQDRELKAQRTKDIGDPIELNGKVIQLAIRGDDLWTAESGAVARRTNLKTGKAKQVYLGHGGPVTCLTFYAIDNSTDPYLITGAWDTILRVWNTATKEVVSTTSAHDDFLKSLVVIPHLKLLASGSSDKTIKLWDLSVLENEASSHSPLPLVGSLSGHTRPVDCLAVDSSPDSMIKPLLYSGDSMGVIKVWALDIQTRNDGARSVRGTVETEYQGHRTGVCEMIVAEGRIWSGSSDSTVLLQFPSNPSSNTSKPQPTPSIPHSSTVRTILPLGLTPIGRPILVTGSGDLLSVWDVTSFGEPDGGADLVCKVDVHSHDITGLGLWITTGEDGKKEAYIISASLDRTIRRWKLSDLMNGTYTREAEKSLVSQKPNAPQPSGSSTVLSEEEERELAELMSDDE